MKFASESGELWHCDESEEALCLNPVCEWNEIVVKTVLTFIEYDAMPPVRKEVVTGWHHEILAKHFVCCDDDMVPEKIGDEPFP